MNCQKCEQNISDGDKYCRHCGHKVGAATTGLFLMSPALLATTIALTSVLVFGILHFESVLIGKAPSNQHVFSQGNSEEYETPAIKSAKVLVEKEPNNLEHRQDLARLMWTRLGDFASPPQSLMLDLIDALSSVLSAAPNDKDSLLMLANLSFNQKVFNKSVEYFQRYLTLDPGNNEARASYASALTFLGQFDTAIKELDLVLKGNPRFFQAIAYKAIAYAQMGKISEAKALGAEALSVAPSEEAKARFSGFIESLDQKPASADKTDSKERPIISFIRSNSVAGAKFATSSFKDGTLTIAFKSFPLDKMPTEIRDSFIGKLKQEALKDSDIKLVKIVDVDSGQELSALSLMTQ